MKLPELIYGNNKTRRQTVAFGGVNYSENHAEGEWEETENLGSGRWPALAPRLGRAVARECEAAPTALYAWEELASVEGTGFYYGGEYIGEVSAGPKQMVRVGDQIVIWPDRKYYNWKTGVFTALEVGFAMDVGLSTVFGENFVALPEETWAVQPVGEPVTYTGDWLGVQNNDRAGDRTKYWVNVWSGGTATQVPLSQIATGNYLLSSQNASAPYGRVASVQKESKQYTHTIWRDWVTVTYRPYIGGYDNPYHGDAYETNPSKYKTMSGWAYTTDKAILNAGLDPNLPSEYFAYKSAAGYTDRQVALEGYQKQLLPSLVGVMMGYLLNTGDLLYYDQATRTGQMFTATDRAYYTDHYYATNYTLQPVELVRVGTNADPEVVCAELGIEPGIQVRVSRGGQSRVNTVAGFDASFTVSIDEEAPGMSLPAYEIRFADSVLWLRQESGVISVDRVAEPELDYICVHDNRLWGVHDNRIYCSVFGDPQDFRATTGTDADAWWTEVGSPGEWTGIVSYSGSVLAFKENLVHKIVGDLPSQFTVSTYNIAGIQPGSHQSAAIINEVLYYKGSNGVYAYSGYTPSFISANFGERKFREAVGGTDGARYYLSMKDEAGAWQLYCYDTIRGVWLREDGLHAAAFSLYDGRLYCAAEEAGAILTFGEAVEPDVPWSAVSVPFYEGSFDRKLYTKLLIRAELPAGSTILVAVSYDGGAWQELYNTRAPRWRVAILPVRPKRCDSFRLRISGEGDITLRGIAREVLTGSEV